MPAWNAAAAIFYFAAALATTISANTAAHKRDKPDRYCCRQNINFADLNLSRALLNDSPDVGELESNSFDERDEEGLDQPNESNFLPVRTHSAGSQPNSRPPHALRRFPC